jgi:hypothetical protein
MKKKQYIYDIKITAFEHTGQNKEYESHFLGKFELTSFIEPKDEIINRAKYITINSPIVHKLEQIKIGYSIGLLVSKKDIKSKERIEFLEDYRWFEFDYKKESRKNKINLLKN